MGGVDHLVIGAGEVGSALHTLLGRACDVVLRDIGEVDLRARTLHIAFPWSDEFAGQVAAYEQAHRADLVIVHSTVPVGTCDPRGWVHSPVRGRHPDLVAGLSASVKHCGGARAAEAALVFRSCGLRVDIHDRAAETEAGKLWELVQFGLQVRVEQAIHAWCVERGLDPDVVYRQFADAYNDCYRLLGQPQFARPVLDHVPGPIGGHCVRACAELLDHPLARLVAE